MKKENNYIKIENSVDAKKSIEEKHMKSIRIHKDDLGS